MSSTSCPCYRLIETCVPYPVALGPIRIARMVQTLIASESAVVVSLEKLAALRMVSHAMTSRIKQKKMIKIIRRYPPRAFSRLIMGDCGAISELILESLVVNRHFCVAVSPTQMEISLEEGRVMVREYPENEVPLEKVLGIMRVVLKKRLRRFTSLIHEDIPNAYAMRINQLATEISQERFPVVQVFVD